MKNKKSKKTSSSESKLISALFLFSTVAALILAVKYFFGLYIAILSVASFIGGVIFQSIFNSIFKGN